MFLNTPNPPPGELVLRRVSPVARAEVQGGYPSAHSAFGPHHPQSRGRQWRPGDRVNGGSTPCLRWSAAPNACVARWRTVPTSKPPHAKEPPGGQGAHVHPPGWTAALGWTPPHFVRGPPGTTAVREMGLKKQPPLGPEGPRNGRRIRQRASGRAVPSPGALRRTTLKKKMCTEIGKDFC